MSFVWSVGRSVDRSFIRFACNFRLVIKNINPIIKWSKYVNKKVNNLVSDWFCSKTIINWHILSASHSFRHHRCVRKVQDDVIVQPYSLSSFGIIGRAFAVLPLFYSVSSSSSSFHITGAYAYCRIDKHSTRSQRFCDEKWKLFKKCMWLLQTSSLVFSLHFIDAEMKQKLK